MRNKISNIKSKLNKAKTNYFFAAGGVLLLRSTARLGSIRVLSLHLPLLDIRYDATLVVGKVVDNTWDERPVTFFILLTNDHNRHHPPVLLSLGFDPEALQVNFKAILVLVWGELVLVSVLQKLSSLHHSFFINLTQDHFLVCVLLLAATSVSVYDNGCCLFAVKIFSLTQVVTSVLSC